MGLRMVSTKSLRMLPLEQPNSRVKLQIEVPVVGGCQTAQAELQALLLDPPCCCSMQRQWVPPSHCILARAACRVDSARSWCALQAAGLQGASLHRMWSPSRRALRVPPAATVRRRRLPGQHRPHQGPARPLPQPLHQRQQQVWECTLPAVPTCLEATFLHSRLLPAHCPSV